MLPDAASRGLRGDTLARAGVKIGGEIFPGLGRQTEHDARSRIEWVK